ncbi:DM13 domain-containing protein [Streptomyces sp. NPDC086787]|uniref:DM13 domain-containing protein n=1 Tax=Streptomyces sp. NPDC086787 TaxID=3365759 RepID=UPI0038272CA9
MTISTPKKRLITAILTVSAAALAVGLYWFQPWKLFLDETVREGLPQAVSTAPADSSADSAGKNTSQDASAGLKTLATGTFISHEHDTEGKVRILALSDGSRVLRLEGLDTSNGPDLRVLLTDAPVKEGVSGWRVFDDGAHISLGKLKGNKGDQNYRLPADVDLAKYSSVSIWCDRFDVSFGAAELAKAAA